MHCMKSVQILSFFWSFFAYIRTECSNVGKDGPERTPYLDTFHAAMIWKIHVECLENEILRKVVF